MSFFLSLHKKTAPKLIFYLSEGNIRHHRDRSSLCGVEHAVMRSNIAVVTVSTSSALYMPNS